ncbi:MAG: FliM/FliN family flagellar motor switch protein [Planctomycetota bacterium]|jgi:flagellar motor switch protein FliN/FliY
MAETVEAVEEKQDQQEGAPQADAKRQAQSVELSEVSGSEAAGPGGSIDILLDMNVPITVTIGRTEMSVQRLLQLGPGSVMTLDKSIDEPADLYLKETRFATGNIVVVDGRFAVKIERILGLGDSAGKVGEE